MGGLGFGQGYFGQYSTGGTVPPEPEMPDLMEIELVATYSPSLAAVATFVPSLPITGTVE